MPYNLVDYSQDFTNSSWTKNNATVTSDNTISPDGAGGCSLYTLNSYTGDNQFLRINPNTTFASGLAHSYSLFVKYNSFQYVKLAFINYGTSQYFAAIFDIINGIVTDTKNISASNTNASIESAGNGWYRIKITASLTSSAGNAMNYEFNKSTGATPTYGTYGRISQTTTTSDKVFMWGGQLVKGDQPKDYLKTTDRLDIPRIDYTNGEPSILLEPSRTNLQVFSTELNNALGSGSPPITSNVTTSPENLQNADKISQTLTSLYQSRFSTITITAGKTWTRSIFAKKDTGNWMYLQHYDGITNNGAYFDLDNGVIGTVKSGVTARMVAYPNGWYRCSVTNTPNASATTERIQVALVDADNASPNKTGNGTGIFIYGAQLEEGSYATSLIHTSGSAVTRSQDSATNAGNSDLINSTEGVLYAEIKALANDGTSRHFSINDGTAANKVEIYYDSTTNEINAHINVSGASSALFSQTFATVLEYHKVAVKYKANDFSMFVDGAQIATDTSGVVFSANTLNNLAFDKGNATLDFYADVKSVMVFKEALTDLELEKLTGYNNHELYMNYYNRLSYLGLAEEYNVESDINNYIL